MLFKSFTHFLHIKSMASTIRFFFSFVTLRGFDSYKMADFFMKKRDFYFKQPPKIEKWKKIKKNNRWGLEKLMF